MLYPKIQNVRGRLAPTPTGLLHVGNARTFLYTWLLTRSQGGQVVLRVEDIDRDRSRTELEVKQLEDLRWLGLDWDEGPDIGGPFAPYRQSERREAYRSHLEHLIESAHAYPCICSRKDILDIAGAPHAGEEIRYPGTCRDRFSSMEEASKSGRRPLAWRYRVPKGSQRFIDEIGGLQSFDTDALVGDFVIWRKVDWPSYQLAVACDDAAMRINEVVRGDDLAPSTVRQQMLYQALELSAPTRWLHLPLVIDAQGGRLAKRRDSLALAVLRERSVSPERVVGILAHSLGLLNKPEPLRASELIADFSPKALPRSPVQLGKAFAGV